MTLDRIKYKVISYVHTKDAHGNWIVPWGHKKNCCICDELAGFIEALFKENDETHTSK